MSRPLIAMPAYLLDVGRVSKWNGPAVASPARYVTALQRAGGQEGLLMPVALDGSDGATEVLERFDGLMLLGGGDVEPRAYGQDAHDKVYGVSEVRDVFEIALARAAIERGMPVLAICRGHQVLNVAFGGTLDQHISDRLPGHGRPGSDHPEELHRVDVTPDSRLAGALGATSAECSSHHHQAVEQIGDGLEVVARADDGVVEGIELADGDGWVVGIQWHPEDTAPDDPVQQRLFDAFVAQAK